jgi:hypothetical protein
MHVETAEFNGYFSLMVSLPLMFFVFTSFWLFSKTALGNTLPQLKDRECLQCGITTGLLIEFL